MAEDLGLLFRLRARNEASPVIHSVQGDVTKLRQTFGSEFAAMHQVATTSLGKVTSSLTDLSGHIPVLGGAVQGLSSAFQGVSLEGAAAGSSLAALAAPVGIAIAAVGALAGGVAIAVKELFELAKSTAEFQGKFFDLSQQVGVAVETLSTLDVIASTTGGSIETVTASLGIFQKNLEASHDPTSKQSKLLKELGVTSLDTEVALRQTLKGLFDLGEGSKQTASTLELFGRGGRFVNAILKESHGNLDEATEKLRKLGLVLSTEAAEAADKFNDDLEILTRQLAAVGRQIGQETIPAFIAGFTVIGAALEADKTNWKEWGQTVAESILAVEAVFGGLANVIKNISWKNIVPFFGEAKIGKDFYSGLISSADSLTTAYKDLTTQHVGAGAELSKGLLPVEGRPGDTQTKSTAKTTNAPIEEGSRLLKQLQSQLNNLSATTELARVNLKLQGEEFKNINPILREHIRTIAASIDVQKLLIAANEDTTRRTKEAANAFNGFVDKQHEQLRQLTEGTKSAIDQADDFIKAYKEMGGTLDATTEQWLRFNAMEISVAEDAKKLITALGDLAAESANFPGVGGIGKAAEDAGNILSPEQVDELGVPPPPPSLDVWKVAFSELKDIGADALGSLAHGVGSLVENWVLLGSAGPQAMRKLVASVLAGVAAQAAVKAVFELAEGFAALFFNPAEAAAHFTSAAIFGSIAGVAAVAGRGVAGNAFQQPASGRTESSGSRSSSTSQGSTPPKVVDVNRNAVQPVHVVIHATVDEGVTIKAIQNNYRLGGEVKDIIHHAMGEPGFAG